MKAIHLKEKKLIDGQNKVVCKLYEAPTVVDGDIVIPALNANRNSTKTSTTQIFLNSSNLPASAIKIGGVSVTNFGSNGDIKFPPTIAIPNSNGLGQFKVPRVS